MILLIAVPFLALIVAILSIRLIRGLRRSAELRSRTPTSSLETAHRKPSDTFHDDIWLPLCSSIAKAAASRLNYQLSVKQRRAIWRTRAPLTLEVLLKEVVSATDSQSIAALLESLPPGLDRPNPTGWCGSVS